MRLNVAAFCWEVTNVIVSVWRFQSWVLLGGPVVGLLLREVVARLRSCYGRCL